MTLQLPSYAVVTPVRNEAENLPRLAASLAAQAHRPLLWLIVDTGSTDETTELAHLLAAESERIRLLALPPDPGLARGGPISRGFQAGFHALGVEPDFVVKLDADLSFDERYFAGIAAEFAADSKLGMASGTCFELDGDTWRERFVTGSTVWGASRAYRRECLLQVLPLEERMGWDGVDEFRANARGWRTRTFRQLAFRHHRREGERDGGRLRARRAQGNAAHYIGYRFWYLVARSLWHARREPAALAMIWGYVEAGLRRDPRAGDEEARAYLRRQQSLLNLPHRALEAAGRRV